jgi:ribosome-binding protein aMBF1 (putative translation factor)
LVPCSPHLTHGTRPEQSDEHVFVSDDLADVDFHGSLCYLTGVSSQTGRRLKTDAGWASEDSDGFASSVGERIRVARQHKGWTQVELADASGLSSNYVARLERGELGASLFVAMRIAEALGITLDGLAQSQSTSAKTTTKRRAG